MVTFKPYRPSFNKAFWLQVAWCVALLAPMELLVLKHLTPQPDKVASLVKSESDSAVSYTIEPQPAQTHAKLIPNLLSSNDIALYTAIIYAQKKADWNTADAAIATLQNPILMGHVLADRYLNNDYKATATELSDWLIRYSDHPQAASIYALILNKQPELRDSLPEVHKQNVLTGYGDDNGLAARGMDYTQTWQAGLTAWKQGRKAEAAKYFSSIAKQQDKLSPWTASAAAYWSWRAYNAIGDKKQAELYLRIASLEPRSFYGILARKQLKEDLNLDTGSIMLTDADMLDMINQPSVRRIIALTEAGMLEWADKEVRARFPQADITEKTRLLALSRELGLASAQISMAKQLSKDGRELDIARYPIPSWQPEGGFKVDPLLIFALMRQESGFRPSAVSSVGALGLMQLMPQTASFMHKRLDPVRSEAMDNAAEPIANITLGQEYVEHLLSNTLVENNLIYMLTAYNAGAKHLQDWKMTIGANNDPLLFVESIPIAQTRHYVMQVMTNYWIYSELVGDPHPSVAALAHNHWPSYDDTAGELAEDRIALAPAS